MVMPSEIAAAGLALPLRCKQSQDRRCESPGDSIALSHVEIIS